MHSGQRRKARPLSVPEKLTGGEGECYFGGREALSLGGQPADTFPVVGVYEEAAAGE